MSTLFITICTRRYIYSVRDFLTLLTHQHQSNEKQLVYLKSLNFANLKHDIPHCDDEKFKYYF